ncbi:MAG: amidohydrolase, partial [Pyrinomonadaceae bacterium]
MINRIILIICVLIVPTNVLIAQSIDLVVTNARIRTMGKARQSATAMAVSGNRIVAVTDGDVKAMIGPNTKVIDAKGRLVIPGFNDAHVHFLETGNQLSSVDLRSAKTPREFVQRIKDFAASLPKGRWILGGQWDHENWTPNNLPTAALIDAATPDNPVFINRLDGHMSLANTVAMRLAGIDKTVKDVAGGEIVRDSSGNPTGIFKDAAASYIEKAIPAPSFEQQLEAAQAATDHAASLGVTSVQD